MAERLASFSSWSTAHLSLNFGWDLSRWTAKTRRFAPSLSSPLVLNVFPCSWAREAASARKPQSPCPPASLIDHEGTSVSMIWSGSCLVEPDVLWTCRRGERSLVSTSPGWVLVGRVRSGDSVLLCESSCVSSCVSLISLLTSRGGEVLVGPSLFRAPKPFDLRVFPLGRPIGMDGEIHIFISIMEEALLHWRAHRRRCLRNPFRSGSFPASLLSFLDFNWLPRYRVKEIFHILALPVPRNWANASKSGAFSWEIRLLAIDET